MIAVYYILRCNPFFFGTDGDGHSVFVGAADKDHVFFFQSQIADVDVGRYVNPCQVSDMNGAVGIGNADVTVVRLNFFSIVSMYLFCYERF